MAYVACEDWWILQRELKYWI